MGKRKTEELTGNAVHVRPAIVIGFTELSKFADEWVAQYFRNSQKERF